MGRKKLADNKKIPIMARVSPSIKAAVEAVALDEHRSASQMIEIILSETPSVRAKIRANGNKKAGK